MPAKVELVLRPYSHSVFRAIGERAAGLLRQAAELAQDAEFANYLVMRASALETDNFQPSDMAWMDMKNNPIELVIGPIETYEDLLFGYRAAYESYVLIKDLEWSERLATVRPVSSGTANRPAGSLRPTNRKCRVQMPT